MRVRLVLVSILLILVLAGCTNAETLTTNSNGGVYEITHNIPVKNLGDASAYWNTDWKGQASQLYDEILTTNTQYLQNHRYIPWQTDCNDMAIEVWERLSSRGIVTLIVVGNLEISHEAFVDCNHAWLMVYSGEGSAAALETTRGKIYTWEDTQTYPNLKQYWEGFTYEKPSDLRADFKQRW